MEVRARGGTFGGLFIQMKARLFAVQRGFLIFKVSIIMFFYSD